MPAKSSPELQCGLREYPICVCLPIHTNQVDKLIHALDIMPIYGDTRKSISRET